MIRLSRGEKPAELCEKEHMLTEHFMRNKNNNVWVKDYITKPLMKMSHGKCAYCETWIDVPEVDHFLCKSKHPNRVVEWDNLLPSCHYCNCREKRSLNCEKTPIIDPSLEEPKKHLIFRNMLFSGRTPKGADTVVLLNYNRRLSLANRYKNARDMVSLRIEACLADSAEDDIGKKRLYYKCFDLLELGQPEKNEYSAIYATFIHEHSDFDALKKKMRKLYLWKKDLRELDKVIQSNALGK